LQDWSKDGRFLLYIENDPKTGRDLWALPVADNNPKPHPVVKTPFDEGSAQLSPDGRWIAYETNESGRYEIVVQPFPEANAKSFVSTSGGLHPRWSANGKELYFVARDGKLMAAPLTVKNSTLEAGTPVPLFSAGIYGGGTDNFPSPQYAVSRDGRFLINQPVEDTTALITVILNWKP